jgi:hypothetical protein
MNYRIKEFRGLFYIQVEEKKTITDGYLWWKKTKIETKWVLVDYRGVGLLSHPYLTNFNFALKGFKTLEKAKEQIQKFKSEPKYYY